MMKKSQVTVFILMGIVVLVVVFLLIAMSTGLGGISRPISDNKALDVYMQQCLQQGVEQGIYLLGMHSGNIDSPTKYLIYNSSKEDHEIEEAKAQLREFVKISAGQCLTRYPNKDRLALSSKDAVVEVFFDETKTRVNIDNVYSFVKGETTTHSSPFIIETDVRYKLVHTVVNNLIIEREKEGYIHDSDNLKTSGIDISVAELS